MKLVHKRKITIKGNRGRYPALGHPVPWAISFFLNEKKINIFRFMHIALLLKVID